MGKIGQNLKNLGKSGQTYAILINVGQIWAKLGKFRQNLGKFRQDCSKVDKFLDKFPDKILDKLLDNDGKFDANLLSCNSALYIAISVAGSNRFGLVYICVREALSVCIVCLLSHYIKYKEIYEMFI